MENKVIKICYLISVLKNSTGKGGHFHSLKALVDKMTANSSVSISVIVVGNKMPSILEAVSSVLYINTKWNLFVFFDMIKLCKMLKKINPDIIHCYDQVSLSIADIVTNRSKVFTFCGGPNPWNDIFAPYCDNMIFFSRENMEYYQKIKRFRHLKLHFIPNRVVSVSSDQDRIREIRKITGNGTVILRIGRFSGFYYKSHVQTIELFKELCKRNSAGDIKLVFVGAVESESILDKLKRLSAGYDVFFFTEDKYTKESSGLIGVADIVVGTGRSLMEAAYMGTVLLSPLENGRFPVLIDEESFDDCFRTNFSQRNHVSAYNEKENLNKIMNSIINFDYRKKLQAFSKMIFDEHFSIEKVDSLHIKIYKDIKHEKAGPFSFLRMLMGFGRITSNVIRK